MITLTLRQIRDHKPCKDGWPKLVKNLGGLEKYGLDTPVTFEQIYKSNGYSDTFWALQCIGIEHENLIRHLTVDYAESVKHLMTDGGSLNALVVARKYADGKASKEQLKDASDDASKIN